MVPRLTREQRAAVEAIGKRFRAGEREITMGGLAGTGKTTIAQQLPDRLGLRREQVAYCAFTGKAADVLNRRLPEPTAMTIHRLIYEPEEVHCERCPRLSDDGAKCHGHCADCYLRWHRAPLLNPRLKLIIVDEASMVSESIHDDLTSYGVPVVWIGDHGQLPPVGGSFNLMEAPDLRLETIHRQGEGSSILKLAMLARRTGEIPFGKHGEGVVKRPYDGSIEVDDMDDWSSDLLVLCGKNRTRVTLNRAVRRERGFPNDRPVDGDRVICLRNNRDAGIFNGMTGTLVDCREQRAGYVVTINVDNREDDYTGTIAKEQFNDERTLSEVPRKLDLWDFGYCLTVHKAQGSEATRVILLEERVGSGRSGHQRWLYTGITRAKQSLEIIGPRREA